MYIAVRYFVREKRSNMERVNATDIVYFLLSKSFIATPLNNKLLESNKSVESNIRTVQRWLIKTVSNYGRNQEVLDWNLMFLPGKTHTYVDSLLIDKKRKRTNCKKFFWMNHIFTNIIVVMKILFLNRIMSKIYKFGNLTKGKNLFYCCNTLLMWRYKFWASFKFVLAFYLLRI